MLKFFNVSAGQKFYADPCKVNYVKYIGETMVTIVDPFYLDIRFEDFNHQLRFFEKDFICD